MAAAAQQRRRGHARDIMAEPRGRGEAVVENNGALGDMFLVRVLHPLANDPHGALAAARGTEIRLANEATRGGGVDLRNIVDDILEALLRLRQHLHGAAVEREANRERAAYLGGAAGHDDVGRAARNRGEDGGGGHRVAVDDARPQVRVVLQDVIAAVVDPVGFIQRSEAAHLDPLLVCRHNGVLNRLLRDHIMMGEVNKTKEVYVRGERVASCEQGSHSKMSAVHQIAFKINSPWRSPSAASCSVSCSLAHRERSTTSPF